MSGEQCLKFSKLFDSLEKHAHNFTEEIRSGCAVVVNDRKLNWQQSDVPGNLTLRLLLFIIFIKSLGDGLAWIVLCKLWMVQSGACSWHAAGQGLPGRNLHKLDE